MAKPKREEVGGWMFFLTKRAGVGEEICFILVFLSFSGALSFFFFLGGPVLKAGFFE